MERTMRAARILAVLAIAVILSWWWRSGPPAGEAVQPRSDSKGAAVTASAIADASNETGRSAPPAGGPRGGESEIAGERNGSVGELVVQLVDRRGAPLDEVDVVLSILEPGRSESHVCAVSDEDGEARLPDEDSCLRRCVEPPFVDALPPRIVLESGPAPREPLRFVVEPTGIVEGVLRDLEGREVDEFATIQLDEEYDPDPAAWPESEWWFARRAANGSRVRFAHVGLGRRLRLWGRGAGLEFASTWFEGPARAGETVTAEVHLVAPLGLVKLELVDERGAPVATRPFEILRAVGTMMSPADVLAAGETDGNGAAEVMIEPRALAPQTARPTHEVRVVARDGPNRWRTGTVSISSSSTDERGRLRQDLGRITVVPAPVLVAGRAVDARGAPVARATVHLFSRRNGDTYSLTWPTDPLTDGEGRFSFWSSTVFDGIQLMANAPSRQRANVGNLRGGSTGVVIELVDAARVRGRFLAPEGVSLRYAAEVELDRRGMGEPSAIQLEILPDGSFESSTLPPGDWDVSLDFLGIRRWERRGLRLMPLEDVDFGEIDLRPGLPTVTVHVVDEDGAPLEALVTPKSREGVEPIEQETSRDGRAVFATLGRPLALRISADSRRAIEVEDVLGSRTVVLPRGIAVEFRLPSDLPPLSDHQQLVLIVREESPETHGVISCGFGATQTEFLSVQRSAHARAGESWTLHLPRPGSYMWTMRVVDTRRPHPWIWSREHDAGPFTVDERGTAQPIPTDVDAAQLAEALRAAER
jgi:hypothetical protein